MLRHQGHVNSIYKLGRCTNVVQIIAPIFDILVEEMVELSMGYIEPGGQGHLRVSSKNVQLKSCIVGVNGAIFLKVQSGVVAVLSAGFVCKHNSDTRRPS